MNMLELVQSYLNSEGYNFLVDLSREPGEWHPVNEGPVKGGYRFDRHVLRDKEKTEVLVFTFHDFKTSQSYTKEFSGRALTKHESSLIAEKIEQQKELTQKEKERRWNDCREQCLTEWEKHKVPTPTDVLAHPYIVKKSFLDLPQGPCEGLRLRTNSVGVRDLLINIQDADGIFWGYQIIHEDGQKEFLEGQRTGGMFHLIKGENNGRIYFCEGYATGLTISLALKGKYSVVVCFNAGNLRTTSAALRAKYEKIPFIFCSDNDKWKPAIGNIGVKCATEAAEFTEGSVVIPEFSSENSKPTDFNDLMQIDGIREVEKQLNIKPRRPTIIYPLGYDNNVFSFTTSEDPQIQRIREFSHTDFTNLAPQKYWEKLFPLTKGPGFDLQNAKSYLQRLGKAKGLFSISKVRGRGVWVEGGRNVIHLGDRVRDIDSGAERDLQDIESENILDPREKVNLPEKITLSKDQLLTVAKLVSRFSWVHEFEAKLLLGWLVTSPLAGVLPWRAHYALTAEKGSGKSTIIKYVVRPILDPFVPFYYTNATEAGLRQEVKADAAPLLIDEFDTNSYGEKAADGILTLFRQSSDKGRVIRGTPGGKSMRFSPSFSGLVAGINLPKFNSSDDTRFAICDLTKNHGEKNWEKFEAEILKHINDEFCAGFFHRTLSLTDSVLKSYKILHRQIELLLDSRTGQQYGTLLSGYWHFLNDTEISVEEAKNLAKEFHDWFKKKTGQEDQIKSESEDCLEHLLKLELKTDERRNIVTLEELLKEPGDGDETSSQVLASKNRTLAPFDLHIFPEGLFVGNKNPRLAAHFSKTRWHYWGVALKRLPLVEDFRPKIDGRRRCGVILRSVNFCGKDAF